MKLILVAVVEAIIDFMLFQVLKILLMNLHIPLQLLDRNALNAKAFANAIAPLTFVAVVILTAIELLLTLALTVSTAVVIHQPLTLAVVSRDIVKVFCENTKAISHTTLELAIVDSLQATLHPVELSASAMELIFEPLTLVAELTSTSLWQLIDDSALPMFHISMEVADVLVAVAHELLSVAVALAVDPVSLVVGLISEGEAPDTVVFVVIGIEIAHIV